MATTKEPAPRQRRDSAAASKQAPQQRRDSATASKQAPQQRRVSAAASKQAPQQRRDSATASKQPFQRFLDEHRASVLAFLRALVGPVDADDCFQETFLAAMRGYEAMDGRHPRAWVMTIARSKAIDHHRARNRRPEPREEIDATAGAEPGGGGLGDLDGTVWSAVATLTDSQREAVALRYAADLPYREIAAALNCSEAAARRRVADGLAALRKNLDLEEVRA